MLGDNRHCFVGFVGKARFDLCDATAKLLQHRSRFAPRDALSLLISQRVFFLFLVCLQLALQWERQEGPILCQVSVNFLSQPRALFSDQHLQLLVL
jgi:hypothetical protein